MTDSPRHRVLVNGEWIELVGGLTADYGLIVALSRSDGRFPKADDPLYSITYRGPSRSGILAPGQSVELEDDMIFNAYVTGCA